MSSNTISVTELAALLASGKSLNVVDVRTPAEFARVHASSARLMPLDELDPLPSRPGGGTRMR